MNLKKQTARIGVCFFLNGLF